MHCVNDSESGTSGERIVPIYSAFSNVLFAQVLASISNPSSIFDRLLMSMDYQDKAMNVANI